ncbi:MAG: haloacid dehalogenase-like hydrolase [Candidatus Parcubacteria bacterium]|jgi:hydroxymethylpyrimidine pyrophosphatase-like HAD family hydrolase
MPEKNVPSEMSAIHHPLTIELEGKRHVIVAITDYDGTAVNELLPEDQRLSTIGPAREATEILERNRILVGVGTSRSSGEALSAQEALHGHGITFAENGATAILPKEELTESTKQKLAGEFGDNLTMLQERYVVRLSDLSLERIDEFLKTCSLEAAAQDPTGNQEMVSTRFSSPARLQEVARHATITAARLSAERIASAYIAEPNPVQRETIMRLASEWGIYAHGHHINLIGKDANKGKAMRFINDHARYFIPQAGDIAGIIPIFFGNGENDIELFQEAETMGGYGVIVGHPDGGFGVSEDKIPASTIRQPQSHEFGGIKASLPALFNRINNRYGTALKV